MFPLFLAAVFLVAFPVQGDVFKAIQVEDLDIPSTGQLVGKMDRLSCGTRCQTNSSNCLAFLITPEDNCYLHILNAEADRWREKNASSCLMWARQNMLDPSCTADNFPFQRGRSRYRFVDLPMDWTRAGAHCVSIGSKLLQLSSESERVFVANFLKMLSLNQSSYIATGLHKKAVTFGIGDQWKWHQSTDELDESLKDIFWEQNEPNMLMENDQVAFMGVSQGYMNDMGMDVENAFVCECLQF